MGGKNKHANRTKNNTRPSSSSHSAELLGPTIPTFLGFSSQKNGVSLASGTSMNELTCNINSDFQVLFKQMSKKDPITRFKTLQQFADLVNNIDVDEVKAILPLWPRMYCMLCTDIDHKVREISHKAHRNVVSKAKKLIAPYLKELAGPWFTSQYDTYAPAASAATIAFEEAFPSEKLNKAVAFCQEEILSYIYDNLINQTPQSLCIQLSVSPEDMQAKYDRTILTSLQGYSSYLQKLSLQQIEEAEESNQKLLSNPKFWKYAQSKVPPIRSSFFLVLISLCQNAKFLLSNRSISLSSAIFNNLEESDPVVLQSVWDAALTVLVTLEDCWSHINIEKQLCAKLYCLLRKGGKNVSTIYPNILPLLSKIPQNSLKNKEEFYQNLFESMNSGFDSLIYTQSSIEGKVMANTFIECLKFIIKQNITSKELCSSLLSSHLIPVLDKMLAGKFKLATKSQLFINVSHLLRYWHLKREKESAVYGSLIIQFFDLLLMMCKNQINSEGNQDLVSYILNNQVQFVSTLMCSDNFDSKSKCHVKFENDAEIFKIQNVSKEINHSEIPEELFQFIKKLVSVYFLNVIEKEDKNFIIAITKIVSIFDIMVFEELVLAVNESSCFKLFSSYFANWLMRNNLKCKELVDLSFTLLKFVTNDEKEYILDEFCGNWLNDSLRLEVCRTLPNFSHDDCVMKWAKNEKFSKTLLSLLERIIDGTEEELEYRDIIVVLLKAKDQNGEFIIERSTIGSIMKVLSQRLEDFKENSLVIEISQELILNAEIKYLSLPSFTELVISLFKLSCRLKTNDEKILKACRAGLGIFLSASHHEMSDFIKKLSDAVKEIILSNKNKYFLEQVISNVSTFLHLFAISKFNEKETEKNIKIVKMFLINYDSGNIIHEKGIQILKKCCHVGYEGIGELDFWYLEKENHTQFSFEPLENATSIKWEKSSPFDLNILKKYLKWNLYVGSVIILLSKTHRNCDETLVPEDSPDMRGVEQKTSENISSQQKESESTVELFSGESKIHNVLNETTSFILSCCLFESFSNYYLNTKYYRSIEKQVKKLKDVVTNLLESISITDFQKLQNKCKNDFQEESVWFILKPIINNLFNKKPTDFEKHENVNISLQVEKCFKKLQKIDISKLAVVRGNYLMICFFQNNYGYHLREEQWDKIFIFIHKFLEEFLERNQFSEQYLFVLLVVSRLYLNLKNNFKTNHTKPYELRILPEVCIAWNEVVQKEIYNKVFVIWRKLIKVLCNKKDIYPEWTIVLQNVADVVLDGLEMRSENLDESVDLALECLRLLSSPHAVIQITSFEICLSVVPDLVKLDAQVFGNNMSKIFQDGKSNTSDNNSSTNANWTIKQFQKEITKNQAIVETLLSDFILGDYCTIEPFTDSFTYTFSYLLVWRFLLRICGEAHYSLRVEYGSWLEKNGFMSVVLESIFKLMPSCVVHEPTVNENFQKYFENYESLDFRESIGGNLIERSACLVYRLILQRLPNCVREWWKQMDNKTSILVDNITKFYVSPFLISNELKNIQQCKGMGFDNVEVKTYPNSREVIAMYTIDEVKMDLIMTLPPNYPLGTAKIESNNVVVGTTKWRNLLFQICKYLVHQNGTIWDALIIWKNNLDKKFEGVEECYICFSILQGSSFEIPRLCCHTCKKKFHSNCLYKWFNTSNNSTCPICRKLF